MECAAFHILNKYIWKYPDQKGQITDFNQTEQQKTVKMVNVKKKSWNKNRRGTTLMFNKVGKTN